MTYNIACASEFIHSIIIYICRLIYTHEDPYEVFWFFNMIDLIHHEETDADTKMVSSVPRRPDFSNKLII